MKVLWLANSPSLASGFLGVKSNGLGWVESLEKEVSNQVGIDLGVAFPFENEEKRRFKIGSTSYFTFPVPKPEKGMFSLRDRWMHKIESEEFIGHVKKIIDEFNPDVIHIFGSESPFGLIIPHVLVPVIIQIQGNLTVCAKKWFSGISFIDFLRYSGIRVILKAYGIWHLYFLFSKRADRERKIMQHCKYYIGRTDWDRRISSVLSPGSLYFHCEELLRDEFYFADKWQKPTTGKVKIISTVSSMAYKGLETVLETARLLKSNLTSDFEWSIAGVSGSEELVGIIERTYKLKFSELNISFKGSLNAQELLFELNQAHIFVHPSHIENSPNSVCEAMLLGMPVVATYAGGTPSIVSNGIDGLLVQDGDPWALTGAILDLLQNENQMLLLGSNAAKRAVIRHNKQAVGKKMAEIYQQVVFESNLGKN